MFLFVALEVVGCLFSLNKLQGNCYETLRYLKKAFETMHVANMTLFLLWLKAGFILMSLMYPYVMLPGSVNLSHF